MEGWTGLVISMPLVAGKCPKGCRSTFSDCNLNVEVQIVDKHTLETFDLKGKHLTDLPQYREEIV